MKKLLIIFALIVVAISSVMAIPKAMNLIDRLIVQQQTKEALEESKLIPMPRQTVDASAEVEAVKQNEIDNINNAAHQDEAIRNLRVDNGQNGSKEPTVFTTIDDAKKEAEADKEINKKYWWNILNSK